MSKRLKKIVLSDLEFCDGVYNVSSIVNVDGNPWVNKQMALEAIDIANSHVDWLIEEVTESIDKTKTE